ncbi:MAG: gamma-glutamylcyclotransferase [Pseudomonadota bacterium]
MGDFWVFGYGSLIWNPGFEHVERRRATLHGLHRSLCIYSWVHRGTKEHPGLVLGLDRGGSCLGMAMKVTADKRDDVIAYLRAREQVTAVYLECWRNITLQNGEVATALVYRADRESPQYAKGLSLNHQTDIVRHAVGGSGNNVDYVLSTVEAMRREGIRDRALEYIDNQLRV